MFLTCKRLVQTSKDGIILFNSAFPHTELITGKAITSFYEINSDDNIGIVLLQDIDDFQSSLQIKILNTFWCFQIEVRLRE